MILGRYPSGLPLHTLYSPTGIENSGLTLFASGGLFSTQTLPLVLPTIYPTYTSGMNLYTTGNWRVSEELPLFTFNQQTAFYHGIGPFYIYGTESGDHDGLRGYFYQLFTSEAAAKESSQDNIAHAHTFYEYPDITFYMPNSKMYHGKETKPNDLMSYEDFPKSPVLD